MSTPLNEIKPKREISKNVIKQKFKNKNWNLDLMPYIGKEFIKHSQKNNKPYNKIRNILILDLGLEEKFKTVSEQAISDQRAFSLTEIIKTLNGEIEIDDIVYHCFLCKKIPEFKTPINKFNPNLSVKDSTKLSNSFNPYLCKNLEKIWFVSDGHPNEKTKFSTTIDELKTSAEILESVIKWSRPDIIIYLGKALEYLIDYAFHQRYGDELFLYCSNSNINCHTIEDPRYVSSTISFLENEKKFRNLNELKIHIDFLWEQTCLAKEIALEKMSRYEDVFLERPNSSVYEPEEYDIGEVREQPHPTKKGYKNLTITRDRLIEKLNEIQFRIGMIDEHITDYIINEDKNYYKRLSVDTSISTDKRVRAGKYTKKA